MMFYMGLVLSSLVSPESASCHFRDETLPIPMYGHLGIFSTAKNAVYLFGGVTGTTQDNSINLNKVYKWDLNDPSSGFVEIGNTPNTGWFYSWIKNAVLVNDQVFFIGIDHSARSTGKIFVYDLNTESFITEEKTPIPYPSWWGCLMTNSTHIFMVDGYDETTTQRLPNIQVYDVAADTWQSKVLDAGPLTIGGWYDQYCSLVGDALYVLGGIISGPYIDSIYRINTHTLAIELLIATFPSQQGDGASIYDGDHNLYLFGAYPTYKQDVLTFDLDTFSASTAFLSQQQFSSAPVLTINGSIYRFGGENNYVAFDEVEICDLPTDMPTQSPTKPPTNPTNSPTSTPTATPSALPTSAPSPIPTQSPTKTPTKVPSAGPTHTPTLLPTATPSGTPTDNPFSDPTMSPTDLPSTLPSNTDEYGVDITSEADLDEIEIGGIYPSNTKSDGNASGPSSTPNENHDWLTIVVIVLVVLISAAMIRKCYVERKISRMLDMDDRIERENDDVANHDDPIVEPGALIVDNIGPALPDVHAEIFEAIHLFNARQAPMMVMPAVINTTDAGDVYDDDDDDLFGSYNRGATNAGSENVQGGKLLANDEPITVEGDHDDAVLEK